MITFFVPGKPVPKGRPRSTIVGKDEIAMSKYGPYVRKRARIKTYTPEKTIAGQDAVKNAFLTKYHPDPADGPLRIDIVAMFRYPKGVSLTKKQAMAAGEIRPMGGADVDNLLKLVMDAMEGLAYKRDSQIATATTKKQYAGIEGVQVSIDRINVLGGQS